MLKFKLFCVLRVFDRLFPLDFGCCVGLLGVLDFLITVCAEWFVVMVDFWRECFVVVNVACVVLVCFGFSGLVTFGCYFSGDLLWSAFACASALYLNYCLFLWCWLRLCPGWVSAGLGGCAWVVVAFLSLI